MTSGTGGSAGAGGIRLGSGGPFPFPQNKTSGACTLTTIANASQVVQAAYEAWKTTFVTATGAGAAGNLRVVRITDSNDTVSEGIGYGMLAAVYMGDRATFDGLWGYAKSHLTGKGLMHWQINSSNAVIGMGSATDADEDIAWALLMASNQWSSSSYLTDAKAQINGILAGSVASDGLLKPGDGWGNTNVTYPDYFSPAYFRAFAAATNNPRWTGDILDRNYAVLMNVTGEYGLVPDRTTGTYQHNGYTYSYDACRMPWRIAMDYCFSGEPRAKAYLTKIGAFFDNIGAANIGDGYSLTGMATSNFKNMAFIGPAGVAGMAGFPKLLDGAFMYGTDNLGDQNYYPQSLKIVTMLMMSGNLLDYSRL
jgi:endo-1,4-beta-D-glucanase Y